MLYINIVFKKQNKNKNKNKTLQSLTASASILHIRLAIVQFITNTSITQV